MIRRNPRARLPVLAAILAALMAVPLFASPALAAPALPPFKVGPEGYPGYQGQSTCSPTPKPGVVEFRALVLASYAGTGDSGIGRDCSIGGQSEHKEGRAWDWHVDASSQGHIAADLLNWLLATRDGQAHALMRRFGIMYIIWNRSIFRAYRAHEGWQPYTGPNPHTDHVHFSFGWAGANQQTTWWTGRGSSSTGDVYGVVGRTASGGTEVHGLSRASEYRQFSTQVKTGLGTTDDTWAFGMGDYTGDGTPDMIAVNSRDNGAQNTAAHVFSGESNYQTAVLHRRLPQMGSASLSAWEFTAGDYNGDNRADLIAVDTHDNAGRNTAVHVFDAANAYGGFLIQRQLPQMGSASLSAWQFTAGDHNVDGRADLVAVYTRDGNSTAVHVLDAASGYGAYSAHSLSALHPTDTTNWEFDGYAS